MAKKKAKNKESAKNQYTKDNCWIIIAAHNEQAHIEKVVKGVRNQGFKHIVVANDGSTDATEKMAQNAIVLTHVINLGKGAAMKTGAEYALMHDAKAFVFVDGDGQHMPEELPLFLNALNKGNAIVFSYRKRVGTMPLLRRLGNWFMCVIIKIFYNITLRDALSGYRAMNAAAYKKTRWKSQDYTVESEMIANAGMNILKYTELEIATIYHDSYKGMTIIDGIPIVFKLIWWRMTR